MFQLKFKIGISALKQKNSAYIDNHQLNTFEWKFWGINHRSKKYNKNVFLLNHSKTPEKTDKEPTFWSSDGPGFLQNEIWCVHLTIYNTSDETKVYRRTNWYKLKKKKKLQSLLDKFLKHYTTDTLSKNFNKMAFSLGYICSFFFFKPLISIVSILINDLNATKFRLLRIVAGRIIVNFCKLYGLSPALKSSFFSLHENRETHLCNLLFFQGFQLSLFYLHL